MEESIIIVLVVLTAVILSFFNLLTIVVMLMTRKLRTRVSNYPIISFLIGSAIQGILPAPLYIYKILQHKSGSEPGWLCDLYRFPYILCVHIMELSIMILSLDRLVAVKFPFKYTSLITRRNSLVLIIAGWLITIGVDTIPFFTPKHEYEKCSYVPETTWGLLVIIFYNLLPFVSVIVCYSIIWRVAYVFALEDRTRSESVVRNQKASLLINENGKNDKSSTRSSIIFTFEIKATKTSLGIVAVYMVCWLPMGVFYMADHFCHNCISNQQGLENGRRAVKLLAFSSSLLAPMIYCWWNNEFRKAARKILNIRKADRTNSTILSASENHY